MTRSFHMGLSVRGALKNWRKRDLRNMLLHDDGRRMTADEAKEALLDELSKGHEVIPMAPCDNWNWKMGCLGHAVQEPNAPAEARAARRFGPEVGARKENAQT